MTLYISASSQMNRYRVHTPEGYGTEGARENLMRPVRIYNKLCFEETHRREKAHNLIVSTQCCSTLSLDTYSHPILQRAKERHENRVECQRP